ncbi:DedA family protein [Brevibacillus panacihumi]|uniref:DedA family protein n=1 Tax=Brevibacillus panacihumi TaxID=497735 RepID=A0A3M8C025_9BACL|nr:DedA family protein [Brevibacillus panacihumi]
MGIKCLHGKGRASNRIKERSGDRRRDVEQVLDVLVMKYGYLGIFGSLALGIIGLPIPDEVLMTYAGFAVARGTLLMPLAFLSAFLGAITGITISYMIGRKWGLPLLLRFGPYLHITEQKIASTQKLFTRYGPFLLVIGFFLPGVRHLTAYLAGMAVMDLRRFILFAYSGAFLWSMTFLQLGFALGKDWYRVAVYARHYGFWLLVIAVLIGLGVYVWRRGRGNPV